MDSLSGLLSGSPAGEAFLLQSVFDPPWSLRIEDESPVTLIAVLTGQMWIAPDAGAPVALGAGDVSLVRGPDHYVVADSPQSQPQGVIDPDHR